MFSDDLQSQPSPLFDRDAQTRMDEKLLRAAWADPTTKMLRVFEGTLAVSRLTGELDLQSPQCELSDAHAYLGRGDGMIYFAEFATNSSVVSDVDWVHPFTIHAQLEPVQREAVNAALALDNWHRNAGFSSRNGEPTWPAQGGWMRVDADGNEYFPRTDPAVIVVVEHQNRLLLGSNVLWESGRFSLLAGFVEAGESAEQAVVREVKEEAGVAVTDVRYLDSQAWPYPRSLMLGFHAHLAPGVSPEQLIADPTEISELKWFTREELRDPAPSIRLPQPLSIARRLINRWVEIGDDVKNTGNTSD